MGEMELEEVESGPVAQPRRFEVLVDDQAHVLSGHLLRDLAVGPVGDR